MRLLLTGASGWLGRHLAPMLRGAGHSVAGLDIAPGPETAIVGSVADRALVHRAFGDHGIEAVIHAGALHKPDIARYPARDFIDANVTGTLNLLDAAVAAGNDRFVFTSTTSLMISDAIRAETHDAAVWLDEASGPIEPRNIYGVTKFAAEQLCRLAWAERGLACVVLRTSRFFPEEDDTDRSLSGPNRKANEFLHRRLTVGRRAGASRRARSRTGDRLRDLPRLRPHALPPRRGGAAEARCRRGDRAPFSRRGRALWDARLAAARAERPCL